MRRRVRQADEGSRPRRLRVYDPADWPNPDCHPECAFWDAVGAWNDAHPVDLDTIGELVLTDGPDVPWHDEWI